MIQHFPVMASNVLNRLRVIPTIMPLKIADCNFGLGGHSSLLLKNFPNAHLYLHQSYSDKLMI